MLSSPLVSSQAEIRRSFRMRSNAATLCCCPVPPMRYGPHHRRPGLRGRLRYRRRAGEHAFGDAGLGPRIGHRTCGLRRGFRMFAGFPLSSTSIQDSATPSTCIERSGYSNGLVPPPYRSKTRSSRKPGHSRQKYRPIA